MAAFARLFYILLSIGNVDSVINDIPSMRKYVGEDADFLWNATVTPIIGSQWGIKDPSGNGPPKPLFISTRIGENTTFSSDLDNGASRYKNRVFFIGNLSIGHAWFRIIKLKISDSNQYRATIQENFQQRLPFTVSLTVLSKDINECIPNPCKNEGTCTDLVNGFNCTCAPGWEGRNCTKDINECASHPCKNKGSCIDLVNGFRCNCTSDWEGDDCTKHINECDSNPCQNGGTCNDLINGYSCTCASRWTGLHCDQNINYCASNPCKNGATCTDRVNGFSCKCVPGWEGDTCTKSDLLTLPEIVGIVIGVLAVFSIIVIVIVVIVKKKKKQKRGIPVRLKMGD